MHEKEIRDIFLKRNMPVGSCSYSEVALNKDDSVFKTVLTTAVPYWFKPEKPHNISIYAMLPDYHKVVLEILESICAELKELFPDNIFEPHVDISPINEKKAAFLGGLGFIGKNTLLINEKFGSFLFIGDICTDAEIHIENEIKKNLCEDCRLCIKACPGNAIHDKVKEPWQCAAYYAGANMSKNPFMSQNAFPKRPDRLDILNGKKQLNSEEAREVINEISYYPPIMHGYISSICGNACDRACYIHLEEKGVLNKKFQNKFRKREEWVLDVK